MDQSPIESTITNGISRIAFIQANWHSDIVDVCRQSFCRELETLNPGQSHIDIFQVPGSFEIPLLAKKLANSDLFHIIVAAGLVVDGGIYRHDFVAGAVVDAMMRVQIDCDIPIISAVLTPHLFHENDEHQAFFKQHFEVKGKEAARACAQTLNNMKRLDEMVAAA